MFKILQISNKTDILDSLKEGEGHERLARFSEDFVQTRLKPSNSKGEQENKTPTKLRKMKKKKNEVNFFLII